LSDGEYAMRDLWQRKDQGKAKSFSVTLLPHACVLYRLRAWNSSQNHD
jgi:hypothetical protein